MGIAEFRRFRQLEEENRKLKRIVAILDHLAMTVGLLLIITTDNETEFTSRTLNEWVNGTG